MPLVIILLIGERKSLLFIVLVYLEDLGITIIIIPF